jgi:uncharacterized protein YkwD
MRVLMSVERRHRTYGAAVAEAIGALGPRPQRREHRLGSGAACAPQDRMDAWMRSDGHRQNILNEDYGEIGVGTRTGEFKGIKGVTIYTVDLGVRR